MANDNLPSQAPKAALGPGLVALYTLANIGAFIAFIPLLQILVPLRAAAIDPTRSAAILSRVALCGAITASLANIAFGALSDRTQGRAGSRVVWLLAGLAGVLLTYALIRRAATPAALLAGVVAFQLAFNAMFAPLTAIMADRVPATQRGMMSALLGLGYPIGNLIGTQTVGKAVVGEGARFLALGMLVAACILPFVLCIGIRQTHPPPSGARRAGFLINPFAHSNFAWALAGRVLVIAAFNLVQGYLLFYLQQLAGARGIVPGRPEAAFAELAAITASASILCALASGALLDRGRRTIAFVFAGALGLSIGITILAAAQSWFVLQAGSLIYGGAAGVFYAVDLALIVQVLPSLQNAGRDLGIVNLSNTVPQAIAPLIALMVLTQSAASFRMVFLLAAGTALLGAACVLRIRLPEGRAAQPATARAVPAPCRRKADRPKNRIQP